MMKPLTIALLGTLLCASLPAQQNAVTPSHTNLKVGDMAPDFTLPATTGEKVTLSSFRGKAPVVLAFFPAAFTGGCTKEMLAYQANSAKFEGAATKVFGISGDNTPSQKEFAKQLNVAFPILSDFAQRKVMADYGVLLPNMGMANRTTFVIDKDGKIVHIEEGSGAIDPSGAEMACSRLAHK
jgi:thioredoxin-dependent peroxiredoxin